MAVFSPTHSSALITILPPSSYPLKHSSALFLKLPLQIPHNSRSILCAASSQQPNFISEQAVLDAVAEFDANEESLPVVRTFENDLARLTLVGAVDFRQAVTAAAADGGEAADEHLSSGISAMVVETVFPGNANEHSTLSTRLFLPARKVKEKAVKLKKTLSKDILQGTTSKNILAMTFRQVVLHKLWSLELEIFRPGTERDMNDLENPRDVSLSLTLSSSNEKVISALGEALCLVALESTERYLLQDSTNKASNRFFGLFNKRQRISSRDSSVILYNLLEHEILSNAGTLLRKFNLERGKLKLKGTKLKSTWWLSPVFSKLEKIGGPEFCVWLSECVPGYMLEIDANKLDDVKLEGWKNSETNKWEAVLTHSQMICLADILDMYFEDVFTLPDKRLLYHTAPRSSNLTAYKGNSLLKMLSIVFASGIFMVSISLLKKLYLPSNKIYAQSDSQTQISDIGVLPQHSMESSKLEEYCGAIIRKIKASLGWSGEINVTSVPCAFVGELPSFLQKEESFGSISNMLDKSPSSVPLGASDKDIKALEEIATYQIVLSAEGKIIGFQPTNRIAVNNWGANPLSKELYGGKDLSPGLLEPGLKISSYPRDIVVMELLMSLNPESCFAFVRALDITSSVKENRSLS